MERKRLTNLIRRHFASAKVVALLGPRQSGKTTLARQIAASGLLPFNPELNYFDLEDPAHLERLATPKLALQDLAGLVVIDEIQLRPELFPVLRVLADRAPNPAQFLILGSASRDLIRQGSETLAGRISFVEITPFGLSETGPEAVDTLWLRGGFPPSFLATDDEASWQWREAYLRTFLERDIPALGIRIPALTLRRFWTMLAHYHGQQFNASELGKSLATTDTTVSRYLDILTGTFMVRRLNPWFENIKKRQIKTPKIYFRDSGILHRLLGLVSRGQLVTHPKLGASWEGFALEEVIRSCGVLLGRPSAGGARSAGDAGRPTARVRDQVHRRSARDRVPTRGPRPAAAGQPHRGLPRRRPLPAGRADPRPRLDALHRPAGRVTVWGDKLSSPRSRERGAD